MRRLAITLMPFKWIWPRFERTVCDSTAFFGPVRITWENTY